MTPEAAEERGDDEPQAHEQDVDPEVRRPPRPPLHPAGVRRSGAPAGAGAQRQRAGGRDRGVPGAVGSMRQVRSAVRPWTDHPRPARRADHRGSPGPRPRDGAGAAGVDPDADHGDGRAIIGGRPPRTRAPTLQPTRGAGRAARHRSAPATRPPLTRRSRHKIVAGVAGGLGDHFHIEPNLVRLAFVVLDARGRRRRRALRRRLAVPPDRRGEDGAAIRATSARATTSCRCSRWAR